MIPLSIIDLIRLDSGQSLKGYFTWFSSKYECFLGLVDRRSFSGDIKKLAEWISIFPWIGAFPATFPGSSLVDGGLSSFPLAGCCSRADVEWCSGGDSVGVTSSASLGSAGTSSSAGDNESFGVVVVIVLSGKRDGGGGGDRRSRLVVFSKCFSICWSPLSRASTSNRTSLRMRNQFLNISDWWVFLFLLASSLGAKQKGMAF